MQRTSELIGKPIVSADRGEKVGTVSDVLLQPDEGRLAALVVHTGILRSERVLPYEEVKVLGRDAVVARSREAVIDPAGWEQRHVHARRSSRLSHQRVITQTGREVGTIADVYVDEASGRVDAYDVATPVFAGLVHRHARLPHSTDLAVGEDAVVVPDSVGDALNGGRSSAK